MKLGKQTDVDVLINILWLCEIRDMWNEKEDNLNFEDTRCHGNPTIASKSNNFFTYYNGCQRVYVGEIYMAPDSFLKDLWFFQFPAKVA